MKKKYLSWLQLFNDKNFHYAFDSNKILKEKKFNSYLLSKIIYPEINKKKFTQIVNFISSKTNLKKNSSILDFGSGNGSFLAYFIHRYNLKKNYSLELSNPLINFQQRFIKKTSFIKTNPLNVNFFKKIKNNSVDISLSNSVFHYILSNKYAIKILDELIRVTKKRIFLYDVKNYETKNKYQLNARIKQNLSKKKYYLKYKNTPIKFYSKKFFKKFILSNYPSYNLKFYNLPKAATDHKYGYCVCIQKDV